MEGRHLFGGLTVEDNLVLAGHSKAATSAGSLEAILQRWPILAQRRQQVAGSLSGGEQQLLAIGRALMSRPHLLMLDEPSWGLAPLVVRELMNTFIQLRAQGVTILLVEQMAKMALQICDTGYVMSSGSIVMEGSAQELLANPDLQASYLGGKLSLEKPKEMRTGPELAGAAKAKPFPPIQAKKVDRERREREREEREKGLPVSPVSPISLRAAVERPHDSLSEAAAEKERLRQVKQQAFRSDQKISELQQSMGKIRKEISGAEKIPPRPEAQGPFTPPPPPSDRRSLELQRQKRQTAWKAGASFLSDAEGGEQGAQLERKTREEARKEAQASFDRKTQEPAASDLADRAAREKERQKREEERKSRTRSGESQMTSVPSGSPAFRNWEDMERIRMEKEKNSQSRGIRESTPKRPDQARVDRKEQELARQQRQAAQEKKGRGV
jgi:ABC-type multidrug transport system ATPase subunit